tara:strand:+ start:38 stop:340 length:303 start_codon:yes stop_codon:yes gene_type:complete
MPKVDGKDYAYTPEGIAAAKEAKERSTFTMKYQGKPSTFPFKSGLGSTAAQPFDVDDLSDLKEQNEAKSKELSKKYREGEISVDEAQQGYKEMQKYENPE